MKNNDGNDILDFFGRDLLSFNPKKQNFFIEKAFFYWRNRGFPYPKLKKEEIHKEYKKVKKQKLRNIFDRFEAKSSTVGLRLANSFHPQMWHLTAHSHKNSPYNNFNDDECLRKILKRSIKFWPNRRCWNPQCIRSLLRIYSGGRVANFRPVVAKGIIQRFSSNGSKVLDFCSGFGGRLLGSLTLNRHYVGIDPSPKQVKGLKRLNNKLCGISEGTAEIICGCAEESLKNIESNSIDLIFTSPPYFNAEQYCTLETQSSTRYKSYDLWKSNFLKVAIDESYRLLKPKKFLIINIAKIRNYDLANDTKSIAYKQFRFHSEYHLRMNAMPAFRSKRKKIYRFEPIYVFQKE